MAAPSIVQKLDLNTAEELIRELTPSLGNIWCDAAGNRPSLIFRGQANSDDGTIWGLTPKAFRTSSFDEFLGVLDHPHLDTADGRRTREHNAVLKFGGIIDAHGHVIPGDHPELRDTRVARDSLVSTEFPSRRFLAMYGLAQHHGIPTRLLDWTFKPFVAAYFAACEVAKRRLRNSDPHDETKWKQEAPFSVFVLRSNVVEACLALDPAIHILTVPSATNANLHAQGGRFTLVQPKYDDPNPLPTIEEVLATHEDTIAADYLDCFPMLTELRVPAAQAGAALFFLSQMGVTAATIYPGLAGAVEALKERRVHHEGPDRSRC